MEPLVLAIILISLSVFATSKKKKFSPVTSPEKSDLEEHKEGLRRYIKRAQFDLTGRFRQSFALEVLLVHQNHDMVCSPISALMTLSTLALGAVDNAETVLLNTIGVLKISQIKDEFQNIIRTLKKLPGVKLNVASRIFVSDKVHLNKTFTQQTKAIFDTTVVKVNLDKAKATANTMNAWIAKAIGKSTKVQLNFQLAGNVNASIINIVTFEGNWEKKFYKAPDNKFHSPKGDITVPMMSCQGFYNYTKNDVLRAHVIEIPYNKMKASFVVVLPYSKTGLTGVLKKLKQTPELLNNVMEEMTSRQVALTLPTFKIQSQQDLIPIYKLMGLNQILLDKSGLTGIIQNEKLTVSQAFQITTIDVNEEGTQAAAGTGVEMVWISLDINRVVFTANHPFMFYIKVEQEQLFAGVYAGRNKVSLFK